jgi:hypothetical protein
LKAASIISTRPARVARMSCVCAISDAVPGAGGAVWVARRRTVRRDGRARGAGGR